MGPLTGMRVLEMAGLGPVPFTAMMCGSSAPTASA